MDIRKPGRFVNSGIEATTASSSTANTGSFNLSQARTSTMYEAANNYPFLGL